MKQPIKNLSLIAVALSSVLVLAMTPVSAHGGADDTSPEVESTSGSNDSSSTGTSDSTATDDSSAEVETHGGTDDTTTRVKNLKAVAAHQLALQRKETKGKSLKQRQNVCENRKKAVDNKVAAFSGSADRTLTRLNTIFAKVQAYQDDQKLPLTDYQTLVATATTKQQGATDAVAALRTVAVNIDCTSTDPASNLGVVKQAAKSARTALKDYRDSLKAIVVALSSATTDDSTGGDE